MSRRDGVDREAKDTAGEYRYILVTQCLQNDFFLNRDCRLSLGEPAAKAMLTGSKRRGSGDRGARERAREAIAGAPLGRIVGMQPGQGPEGVRALELSKDAVTNGPLGHFLEA